MRNYRRLSSCFVAIFFLVTFASSALSQDNETKNEEESEELTDQNICKELTEHRKSLGLKEKFSDFKEVVDFVFNKSKLGKSDLTVVNADPQQLVSSTFTDPQRGRNYIISLGVDKPAEISAQEFAAQTQQYEALTNKIEAQAKILARMSSTRSKMICSAIKRISNFSWEAYQRDIEKKSQFVWGKRHLEFLEVQKIVKKEVHDLHLRWIFVQNSSIDNVDRILRDPNTRNVVLMNHGREIGEILDANDAFYPPTFFKNISPSVRSLSLFSCHSTEAIKYYDLQNIFAKNPSYFHQRFLFSVRANGFMKQKNIAVLASFKYFLKGVDSFLYKNDPLHVGEWRPGGRSSGPICNLRSPDFSLRSGTVGLSLNGQFIGSVSAGRQGISADFDCSLLNGDGENTVVISNLRFNQSEQTVLTKDPFSLQFSIPEQFPTTLTLTSFKTVLNDDSSFRKSIFKFQAKKPVFEDLL